MWGPSVSGRLSRPFHLRAPLIGLILLASASGAAATPADEAIIPLDRYTIPRGKALASTFGAELRQIYDRVSRCRPWLDIRTGGLGFTRPVGVSGDQSFLNIWVWVEQEITPEFAALSRSMRYSAMFSRHGIDLLRQLTAHSAIFADPALTGYSVILTWLKPDSRDGEAQVSETLGVFADKATVRAFLARRLSAREFVRRARIVAFDGKKPVRRLPLHIWEDNFASTFKAQHTDGSVRC